MSQKFGINALPLQIPVFPLDGALVLPRAQLPLNIFEPRYVAMVKDVMGGERLIGMIQTKGEDELYEIGGLGRVTQFADPGDGRFTIVLTGLTRFRVRSEVEVDTPYRQVIADYSGFASDFRNPEPLMPAMRAELEDALKTYLDAQNLSADWDAVSNADDESLINSLASVCPFDPAEKQALLEAGSVQARAATLSALMSLSSSDDEGGTMLH